MYKYNNTDYHIHYYLDKCANREMTIDNILKEAERLNLDEICILKHYSKNLPNNKKSWVYWKKIIPEQFESYLKDINTKKTSSPVRLLSGVETEILNDNGQINIPGSDAEKLNVLLLSVHWLPDMSALKTDHKLIPGEFHRSPSDSVSNWINQINSKDVSSILENFVSAYVNAVKHNNYPLILAHMSDGLEPLRNYKIPVDKLSDNELNYIMEPLMKICSKKHVLWELTEKAVKRSTVLKQANKLGVKFTATVDAHCLHIKNHTNLAKHNEAEEYLNSLGLKKGNIKI